MTIRFPFQITNSLKLILRQHLGEIVCAHLVARHINCTEFVLSGLPGVWNFLACVSLVCVVFR